MLRLDILTSPRSEHRLLATMLVTLHLALWADFGGALSRSMMLAHLGLFLLWQPVWSRNQRLDLGASAIFIALTLLFVVVFDWWLVTVWMLLLTGLVGGRVTQRRAERNAYLSTLVFLVSELLISCIPAMFQVRGLTPEISGLFTYGLLAVPAGLFFVPFGQSALGSARQVDFLYGLNVSLLATILGLGSLLSMYVTGAAYPVALFQTIIGISLFLLAISWLWMPLAGFSGLGQLWERYLQNIGTPFEHWLSGVSQLSGSEQTSSEFLRSAAAALLELPWVSGVRWRTATELDEIGSATPHAFRNESTDLNMVVYAHRQLGTALALHGKLLLTLVDHFYRAKERERELAQRAHLQAVYETGARVTHDIKNLLQSLRTITSAVEHSSAERSEDLQRLLSRQLPSIGQRLELALDKLQAPMAETETLGRLGEWWASVSARNSNPEVEFHADIENDGWVPTDLLDSTLENLLENARLKRQLEPELRVEVTLEARRGRFTLAVTDTGSGIPARLVRDLLNGPVRSRSGLGIGLYQAARQAQQAGLALTLDRFDDGHVQFSLSGALAESAPEREAETG